MASVMGSIVSAVKAALVAVNGSGAYTYDLSATGAVHVGQVLAAPRLPFVSITGIGWDSDTEAPLTRYRRTMLISIYGAVGSSTDAPEARVLAALDLLDDITQALEVDPTLGGLVHTLIVRQSAVVDGLDEQAGQVGAVFADLAVTYSIRTGV